MADYISKEIAINRIKYKKPHVVASEYGLGYGQGLKDAIEILNATPAANVQPIEREKWKEILYDAVKELEYYETHGDLLDRHIWKYKAEALALIGGK